MEESRHITARQNITISLAITVLPHWLNVAGTGIQKIEGAKISTLYPLYFYVGHENSYLVYQIQVSSQVVHRRDSHIS